MVTAKRTYGRLLILGLAAVAWSAIALISVAPRAASAAGCASGTLIRGSLSTIYYCGADGKRYVFPNLKTYQTWYPDFSGITRLSDADLAAVPLGGNATYRPGVRLVKITTDPKVYAVDAGGVLRWISSENVAIQLYGSAWSTKVDDVPDAFFVNYLIGSDITSGAQFVPSSVAYSASSINVDKRLGTASSSASNSSSSANGTVSLVLSPYSATLASGQSTTVTATAYDPDGISSIYIFANGSIVQTCPVSATITNATCSVVIYGANYSTGSTLPVYGQVMDRAGRTANSSTSNLTIGSGSGDGWATVSLSPYSSTLAAGQTTTATVTGYDPHGVSTVYVIVNGSIVQTCPQSGSNANASCAASISASLYYAGSVVTVTGRIADVNGTTFDSVASTLTITGSASGSASVAVSVSPYNSTLAVGQTTTATVSGNDPDGISIIYVYANGAVIKSCPQTGTVTSATCSAVIYGSNYSVGAGISIYGSQVDKNGASSDSGTTTLSVVGTSGGNGTVSISLAPNSTTLAYGQSTTVTATAYDPDGVATVYIYANGSVVQTCPQSGTNANATCSVVLYGSNYTAGSTLSIYAREVDRNGGSVSSATSSLTIGSASSSSSTGTVSVAFAPNSTTLAAGQTTTATVSAYDPDGIAAVYIYVNGSVVQTCNQGNVTNATCATIIYGASYAAGSTVSVYGRAVDKNGASTNSATSSLTIGSTSSSNGTVSIFLTPDVSTLAAGGSLVVTVNGYDPAGLAYVNIFVNGSQLQSCPQPGSWPLGASCSGTVYRSNYAQNSTLSIYGQTVNRNMGTADSATRTVTLN